MKATGTPRQFILAEPKSRVLVTQPRRVAAVEIAKRVAKERGERLGKRPGPQEESDPAGPAGPCFWLDLETGSPSSALSRPFLGEGSPTKIDYRERVPLF